MARVPSRRGSTAIIALPTNVSQTLSFPTKVLHTGRTIDLTANIERAKWAGRIAMAEANTPIRDRASLLEGAFKSQMGEPNARITLDVSYVDGFTVPIVCECGGEVVLSCNLNLLEMCPIEYRLDAATCMNPLRDGGNMANNFFKDCASLAYTFPSDDLATINGVRGCEASIRCCVGTACPPHPRQKLLVFKIQLLYCPTYITNRMTLFRCPAADGTAQLCPLAQPQRNSSVA
ncbi:hypothetical protein F5Y10DRAFT_229278 [Nemania abortiva]|nr:hypothetical protein F5Y10DRAFT_229278 [Nemania abortiva]